MLESFAFSGHDSDSIFEDMTLARSTQELRVLLEGDLFTVIRTLSAGMRAMSGLLRLSIFF